MREHRQLSLIRSVRFAGLNESMSLMTFVKPLFNRQHLMFAPMFAVVFAHQSQEKQRIVACSRCLASKRCKHVANQRQLSVFMRLRLEANSLTRAASQRQLPVFTRINARNANYNNPPVAGARNSASMLIELNQRMRTFLRKPRSNHAHKDMLPTQKGSLLHSGRSLYSGRSSRRDCL